VGIAPRRVPNGCSISVGVERATAHLHPSPTSLPFVILK
jgi:hypothetical protein